MKPLKKYITTFQGVDIAIGFENLEDIKQYQKELGEVAEYEFALIDIDSPRGYKAFEITPENKHYFVKNQTLVESYKFIATIITYIDNQNHNPKHVNFLK